MNDIQAEWIAINQRIFKAHIADVDGNLTKAYENAEKLSDAVILAIQSFLKQQIPFALSSARPFKEGSLLFDIPKNVFNQLNDEALKFFFIFSEMGCTALSFYKDENTNICVHETDLVDFFQIPNRDILKKLNKTALFDEIANALFLTDICYYKADKKYGFHLKLTDFAIKQTLQNPTYILNITHKINDYLQKNYPFLVAYCSRKTLNILLKGADKELSVRYLAQKFHLKLSEIVATDDQGTLEGIGYHLIKHAGGFSTNIYDKDLYPPFPLPLISNNNGVDAWFFLNEHLHYQSPILGY